MVFLCDTRLNKFLSLWSIICQVIQDFLLLHVLNLYFVGHKRCIQRILVLILFLCVINLFSQLSFFITGIWFDLLGVRIGLNLSWGLLVGVVLLILQIAIIVIFVCERVAHVIIWTHSQTKALEAWSSHHWVVESDIGSHHGDGTQKGLHRRRHWRRRHHGHVRIVHVEHSLVVIPAKRHRDAHSRKLVATILLESVIVG